MRFLSKEVETYFTVEKGWRASTDKSIAEELEIIHPHPIKHPHPIAPIALWPREEYVLLRTERNCKSSAIQFSPFDDNQTFLRSGKLIDSHLFLSVKVSNLQDASDLKGSRNDYCLGVYSSIRYYIFFMPLLVSLFSICSLSSLFSLCVSFNSTRHLGNAHVWPRIWVRSSHDIKFYMNPTFVRNCFRFSLCLLDEDALDVTTTISVRRFADWNVDGLGMTLEWAFCL